MAEQRVEEERALRLDAGLIAAAIYNVHRKKGVRMLQAADFVSMPDDYMSIEAARAYLDGWAVEQSGTTIIAPTAEEVEKYRGG